MRSGANGIIGKLRCWDGMRCAGPGRGRDGAERGRRRADRSTPLSVRSCRCVAPARRIAADLAPRRRSAVSARRTRKRSSLVSIVRCRPVSGSSITSRPTSGSRSSRGSTTSTAMTSLRRASRDRAGLQVSMGAMKSDTTIASPRRRRTWRRPSMARPRSTSPPSGARATLPRRPVRCRRPPRTGTIRVPSAEATTAPMRSPPRTARADTAEATVTARSAFRQPTVPKSRLPDRSTRTATSRSRSWIASRTYGSPVRARIDQSMRRTSSPGSYGRASPGSTPWPSTIET